MQAVNKFAVNEKESSSLLDCYRIALDFGMPAALKAYEKLTQESMQTNNDVNDHIQRPPLLNSQS